jgi:signal transduction histidine kinase
MKKILVIDDEEWLREMVVMALGQRGYQVIEAANGDKGVEVARQQLPDLVLCDVNMGKTNGYTTLSALRNDSATATIPFILMTGMADNTGMRQGMELGANDYLPKPFTLDALYAAVEARLKMHEKVQEKAGEALQDLRENLSMMLPHELRTPLNGILAYGEMLATDPRSLSPEEIADMGQDIAASGRALQRLIETFLAHSQIEIIRADPQRIAALRGKVTPAAPVIERQARQIAGDAKRPADLQLKLATLSLPLSEEYLAKLVEEVVHNAFKFSKAGSPVQVELRADNGKTQLVVTDRGRGITADQITKLGAFMQFDRKTHEQQGLGLGLTIARRLAEIHGGNLSLTSDPATGTVVTATFPSVR